jgi:hypothetical protein
MLDAAAVCMKLKAVSRLTAINLYSNDDKSLHVIETIESAIASFLFKSVSGHQELF